MSDDKNTLLKLNFDTKVRLDFRGAAITLDAGLLACRELDHALNLTDSADDFIKESRTGKNIRHKLIALLRPSVYNRLAGYDDINDADRLSLRQAQDRPSLQPGQLLQKTGSLPEAIKRWSLTSVQTRLIKIGGRLARHARRLCFNLLK
jgi:hypothetical protein